MLEPAGKIGHVIASPIQQQYNFLLLEKVSKMVCLLNSCEVADFWILSCAAGIYVIVCWGWGALLALRGKRGTGSLFIGMNVCLCHDAKNNTVTLLANYY